MATNGTIMQTITSRDQCPTTKVYAVDARDNHTYWIQKIPNSGGANIDLCWMLTNLAYAGTAGPSTSDETAVSVNISDGSAQTYYINKTNDNVSTRPEIHTNPGGTAYTTNLNPPSTATGGATGAQYGYLYNWCAAMGGTSKNPNACGSSSSNVSTGFSICPGGWRLPTGGSGGEFSTLYSSSSIGTLANLLATWLGVYSGGYLSGLSNQGSYGGYWSSTAGGTSSAYFLFFSGSSVSPSYYDSRNYGFAVRCVL
jgi:hypothetical protein